MSQIFWETLIHVNGGEGGNHTETDILQEPEGDDCSKGRMVRGVVWWHEIQRWKVLGRGGRENK